MKTLQAAHTAAVTIDNLMSAYDSTAVNFVSSGASKEDIARYPHLAKKAEARKTVYDAAKECQKAAEALDDANEKLVAALREVRKLNP